MRFFRCCEKWMSGIFLIFWIFQYKSSKIDINDCFKENLFFKILFTKRFCEKSMHVLIFWLFQWYKGLILTQTIFLGAGSCTGVCEQKEVESEFFEHYNKSMNCVFLIFCMKLEQPKSWKLGKIILTELLF